MTSSPKGDPKQPCEGGSDGTPSKEQAAGRLPVELIFEAFHRECGSPLSEVVRKLGAEGKARMLDMLLARFGKQELASTGEGDYGTHP